MRTGRQDEPDGLEVNERVSPIYSNIKFCGIGEVVKFRAFEVSLFFRGISLYLCFEHVLPDRLVGSPVLFTLENL